MQQRLFHSVLWYQYSSVIGTLHLVLMLYVCYSLAPPKKASTTHCLIRKYRNLQTCVVATEHTREAETDSKMSVILASCQTGCKYEPVQTREIRFLILKSLILLHTLLSSKNTSPSSKHPPPSLPPMLVYFGVNAPHLISSKLAFTELLV